MSNKTSASRSDARNVESPAAEPAGIYVHWPFCARKCPYCDFFTFGREHPDFAKASGFAGALLAEIRNTSVVFGALGASGGGSGLRLEVAPAADTIYLGGGTPSLMEPGEIAAVIQGLGEAFALSPDSEITMEVNPTAADIDRLKGAIAAGVNRISLGCQSFDDRFLTLLGRDHDAAMGRQAVEKVRALGFANVSLDIMFGLPGQTQADFDRDLAALLAFEPEHISAYGLTLHSGTPFKRWEADGRLVMPGDEVTARMYETLIDRMGEAGYVHYEISNWARPGLASRHNSKYWRKCDVYAFGPSAHGFLGGRRYSKPRDLDGYLRLAATLPEQLVEVEQPPSDERTRFGEVMMLALRRIPGVEWRELDQWCGRSLQEYYRGELDRLCEGGMIEADDEAIRLTRRGLLVADRVMEEFF